MSISDALESIACIALRVEAVKFFLSILVACACAQQMIRASDAGPTPRRTALPLQIVDRNHLMAGQAEFAEQEVRRIWSQFGVDVIWNCGTPGIVVDVESIAAPQQRTQDGPIVASLTFHDGVPEDRLFLWHPTAERLTLGATWNGLPVSRLAPGMRDQLIGRLIGRAISHELGHYLLRSRSHAASGLMRAVIGTDLFLRSDIGGFGLGTDDLRTVAAWERTATRPLPNSSTCAA